MTARMTFYGNVHNSWVTDQQCKFTCQANLPRSTLQHFIKFANALHMCDINAETNQNIC